MRFFLFFLLSLQIFQLSGQTYSAMSFNIRYDNPGDNENAWDQRKVELAEMIQKYHPDILGIQEGLFHQLQYIKENLTDYEYFGVGRDDGVQKGEYTAIFYNTSKFKLISDETFWLSKKPETISQGWDAAMERICTKGRLIDKLSKKSIHVFNSHFDHIGKKARRKSAQLILKKISSLEDSSYIILMGDFNSEPKEKPIILLSNALSDGQANSKVPFLGPVGTYNNFNPDFSPSRRIDYIFSNNLNILSYEHLNLKRANRLCISDHLPVLIKFEFQ